MPADFIVRGHSPDLFQLEPQNAWARIWLSRHAWEKRHNGENVLASAAEIGPMVERILDEGRLVLVA